MTEPMSDYCLDIVRQHDPDRFMLSLLAPMKARAGLLALFAFNYEIAKTRDVVSETQIGLIRLQWWRDALKEIYDGATPRAHKVIEPLAETIKQYDLPREDFDALIYAREFDLEGVAPANIEGLMHYCDYTTTPLYRLALKICGQSEIDSVLKSIASRYALVGLVRAVPYMILQRRLMLPQDVLAQHEVSEQKLIDFNDLSKIPDIIKDVLNNNNQLQNAQSKFLKNVCAMTKTYERQIRQADYDVYNPVATSPKRFMFLQLWLKNIFGLV